MAIPRGTFIAIILSSTVYLVMAWLISFVMVREAPGICLFNQFYFNSSLTANTTCATFMPPNFTCPIGEDVALWRNISAPCGREDCLFGLLENTQMIRLSSATGFLVTAGIFSATLSSALTSLISAPKVCLLLCLFVYLFTCLPTYLFTRSSSGCAETGYSRSSTSSGWEVGPGRDLNLSVVTS